MKYTNYILFCNAVLTSLRVFSSPPAILRASSRAFISAFSARLEGISSILETAQVVVVWVCVPLAHNSLLHSLISAGQRSERKETHIDNACSLLYTDAR